MITGSRLQPSVVPSGALPARLRLGPTRHARRPFPARASRVRRTRRSLVPPRRKPLSETWLNCEDPGRSRSLAGAAPEQLAYRLAVLQSRPLGVLRRSSRPFETSFNHMVDYFRQSPIGAMRAASSPSRCDDAATSRMPASVEPLSDFRNSRTERRFAAPRPEIGHGAWPPSEPRSMTSAPTLGTRIPPCYRPPRGVPDDALASPRRNRP